MRRLLALVLMLVAFTNVAHAFPENIRHGYVNCTSCHVSPTGGGTLSPYGRSLAAEVVSKWSYKGEEDFLHGLLKEDAMPEWLQVGGELRGLQLWTRTKTLDQKKWIPMQTDLEVAVHIGKLTLDSTLGPNYQPHKNNALLSRRYFAMYNITDEASVRAGRFYPQFGILVPDHYLATRSDIGFDELQERENIEGAWNNEKWSFFLTGSQSPGEVDKSIRETSVSAQGDRIISDQMKAGLSLWSGHAETFDRFMTSVHGTLGFSKNTFLLSDFVNQWQKSFGTETRGFFNFDRFGYELSKGLVVFGQLDYSKSDLSSPDTERIAVGPGIQFFPRPHFEFLAIWEKLRHGRSENPFSDYAFLLAHYYF
jgi:hypothetical protein